MAKHRRGRPISGILVLDKPAGQSSNQALQKVKWLYNARKAGHTGSLDPLATGVLPICFGEATKFSQFLLDADKAYRSTFQLGTITATGDADGEVLRECDASAVSEADVRRQLQRFQGVIEQVPSMYSALKHNGQPLYKLARQGVEVERRPRSVTVYRLELEGFRDASAAGGKPEVDVMIQCSKGTYVRTIAEDLGSGLGCGAHVKVLRREASGPFQVSQAVSLQTLEMLQREGDFARMSELLLPVDIAVERFPAVQLAESSGYYMQQGQAVLVPHAPTEGIVRMYSEAGCFLGIGEILEDGRVGPRRLMATG